MRRCRQNTHYLTTQLLSKLGNDKPTKQQMKLADTLLLRCHVNLKIAFHPRLTQREASCLLLAANGKSVEETAFLLSVKPTTVLTWQQNILRKLKSHSIAQAVFTGISYGYLQPQIGLTSQDLSSL